MNGSYVLDSFTKNREIEVKRLKAQVDLFFEKEFEIYTKVGLKDGMDIIDCGSGPGFLMMKIKERLPNCNATTLELDEYLFDVLKKNSVYQSKMIYRPINESIYNTKLPDNSFDFVITRLVIEHLEEPLKVMFELNRILRPGGKLVVVSNDFAYHLLTYPIIPELHEMYEAYCRSRFSEGGNPMIGRQIPDYLENSNFKNIDFNVVISHNKLSGDDAFLKAENVNISKSLVEQGFLKKETLANLVEKWFSMLKTPGHIFYRQLFIISGEKIDTNSLKVYSEDLEERFKVVNPYMQVDDEDDNIQYHREKFRNIMLGNRVQDKNNENSEFKSKSYTPGAIKQDTVIEKSKDGHSTIKYNIQELENVLLALWKEILNNESVNIDDNYFDIGGDSVLIPDILSRLETQYSIKIRILDVFEYPTIRQLSQFIFK